MAKFTFETAETVWIGTSFGYHTFTVDACDWSDAWTKVRKLTSLALVKVLN